MSNHTVAVTSDRSGIATAAQLLVVSPLVNLAVLGIGMLAGGSFMIDNAGTTLSAGPVEVIVASILPLAIAIAVYALLGTRVAVLRRTWTPAVSVITLLSLGAVAGASDLTTAISLGTMHLVVGGLAAFGIPARLGQ